MNNRDPKLTVLQFTEYINNRDIESLSHLMAQDYKFVDSSGDVLNGKETNLRGWSSFFSQFPDYLNHFATVESRGENVLITGHSTCSDKRLDGPAIWTATVANDLIVEWRVYLDTPGNRERLALPAERR